MRCHPFAPLCLLLVALSSLSGCFPSGDADHSDPTAGQTSDASSSGSDSGTATEKTAAAATKPADAATEPLSDGDFVLGDLVEAFEPPELDKLVADNQWREMPVLDSVQRMRDRKAGEDPPPTVADALALRNTSPVDNDKILAAMGKLADDKTAVDDQAEWRRHTSGDVKSTNPAA